MSDVLYRPRSKREVPEARRNTELSEFKNWAYRYPLSVVWYNNCEYFLRMLHRRSSKRVLGVTGRGEVVGLVVNDGHL